MSTDATPADVIEGRARWCVVEGDATEVTRSLPDGRFDALVTDPPSGIAFMGAEWDRNKGGRAQWVAWLAGILGDARRATRDGGRSLVWALPRTTHWTGCAVEDAGWAIETVVTHLFGTGWPKGASQLKPSSEHWYLARTGPSTGLNVDGCRVTYDRDSPNPASNPLYRKMSGYANGNAPHKSGTLWGLEGKGERNPQPGGRWPPNTVFTHSPGCERVRERRVQGNSPFGPCRTVTGGGIASGIRGGARAPAPHADHADPDGTELVDAWRCVEGCPVAELDRQGNGRNTPCVQTILPAYSGLCPTQNEPLSGPSAHPMAAGIGNGESPGIAASSSSLSTDGSGRWSTGQSRPGSTSITSTTTAATTDSKISNCSRRESIADSTAESAKITESSTESSTDPASDVAPTSRSESSADAPLERSTGTASRAQPSLFASAKPATEVSGGGCTTRPSRSPRASQPASPPEQSAQVSRFFPQFPADDPDAPWSEALFIYAAKPSRAERNAGCEALAEGRHVVASGRMLNPTCVNTGLRAQHCTCGACAFDAAATPRAANNHPTVKSIALMRWLIRLVTKPGDVVLDPFGGSGTTGVAALLEGRRVVLVEREPQYAAIARARLAAASVTATPAIVPQPSLFAAPAA